MSPIWIRYLSIIFICLFIFVFSRSMKANRQLPQYDRVVSLCFALVQITSADWRYFVSLFSDFIFSYNFITHYNKNSIPLFFLTFKEYFLVIVNSFLLSLLPIFSSFFFTLFSRFLFFFKNYFLQFSLQIRFFDLTIFNFLHTVAVSSVARNLR